PSGGAPANSARARDDSTSGRLAAATEERRRAALAVEQAKQLRRRVPAQDGVAVVDGEVDDAALLHLERQPAGIAREEQGRERREVGLVPDQRERAVAAFEERERVTSASHRLERLARLGHRPARLLPEKLGRLPGARIRAGEDSVHVREDTGQAARR